MPRGTDAPTNRDTVPTVNREVWATEVRSLIETRAAGNLTAFARLIGTDRGTVGRWKRGAIDVSTESVIKVARAFDLKAGDLLVRVGLLEPVDLRGGRR